MNGTSSQSGRVEVEYRETEVRLSDGPTRYAGRLEIQNNSVWETVCSDLVDNKTAVVVCRMLGFEGGNISVYYDGRFKNGSGSMKSHGYDCQGNETDIANCKSTETIVSCSTRLSAAFNCYSNTPIRLQDGTTMFNGRVEIYERENAANGYWREMCYDQLTIQDAMVLCKMLGHPNVHPRTFNAYSQYNSYGRFSTISSIGCTGNETDISGCTPSNQWALTYCSTSNRAAINCAQNSTVRVADGPSIKAGRVEILYNGTWLGICRQRLINYNYNDITAHDINIICKHLGYNQSGYLMSEVQPRSKSVVRNLDCSSTEGDISDCKSDTWGIEYPCDQAAIVCNSSVRLVNGSSERSGRVEVLHQGRWGTICADEFTNREADVVCRKAGIRLWFDWIKH
ncbi:neurotrypsin-like [Dreissena polymorpha]|uniref:neurotrypsin-like n=1 Tax=Dreissena polymorpha TaxID=45954 RepID=UPI002264AE79|nr:neurotrypsin-like [Dreissena polymorpha]